MAPILEPLGEIEGKRYFLDLRPTTEDSKGQIVPNPSYNHLVWAVPDLREAIIAEPGYVILSADYSQIEVKLMAYLSGDPVLIAAINSGKDIHSFNATEVFGSAKDFTYEIIQAAKKDKKHPRHAELVKLRNDIKTVTFGVPYGAGKNKVALMTGMEPETAQAFIDAFFAKFHVLRDWLAKQGDLGLELGFNRTPRGRHRFYDLPGENTKPRDREKIESQIRRYAGNLGIQASNVDMLKPSMYQIYNDLRTLPNPKESYNSRGARILFCVHDEIVICGRDEDGLRRDESGSILTLEEMEDGRKTSPGPLENIMMYRMNESYESIVSGIINKIDVSISRQWEKA